MSRPNGVEKPSFDLLHHERRTIEQLPSLFQTVSLGSSVNEGILPLIARSLAQGPSLLPLASFPKAGYVLSVAFQGGRYRKDDRYEPR